MWVGGGGGGERGGVGGGEWVHPWQGIEVRREGRVDLGVKLG